MRKKNLWDKNLAMKVENLAGTSACV